MNGMHLSSHAFHSTPLDDVQEALLLLETSYGASQHCCCLETVCTRDIRSHTVEHYSLQTATVHIASGCDMGNVDCKQNSLARLRSWLPSAAQDI